RQLGIVGTSISNWFGAFAPGAVSDGDKARLEAAIQQMVHSPRWLAALKPYHLRSTYLDAADFSQLVAEERTRISKSEAITSVAHLMLKGLRLKDIAGARNTSDRTVRQQAQAIYRKAGLDGRTDLAAYFLESVLGAPELDPVANVAPAASSVIAVRPPVQAPVRISASLAAVRKTSRQHAFRGATVRQPAVARLTAV